MRWRARRQRFAVADGPKVPSERLRSLQAPLNAKSGDGAILAHFPIWAGSQPSARACEVPHLTFFSSSYSLGRREQLPLALHVIEDEIDHVRAAAPLVLDLGYQDRLPHAVAHRLTGGGADFFRVREQLAVRADARAGVQLDGSVDTGRVEQLAVEVAAMRQLLFDFGTAHQLCLRTNVDTLLGHVGQELLGVPFANGGEE